MKISQTIQIVETWNLIINEVLINVMLSVSRLAARSASTSLLFRSYGKIRELAATVPGKNPVVCSPEEVVECVKSDDKVLESIGMIKG